MTVPFTDDDMAAEKETVDKGSFNENEEHDSENSGIKNEVKVLFAQNLEETACYQDKCVSLHGSTYLDTCFKPIIYVMEIVLSLAKNIQLVCKLLKTDQWYRKVTKKVSFGDMTEWNSKSNKWIFDTIVKPLRHIPRYLYSVYPFFPEKYDSIVKDDKQKQTVEMMTFEAARLSTFCTFPTSAGVFATRLASAGFYYNGQGDEVICFRCGVKHSNWRKQDSPMDIHRKMSPQCSFVSEMMNGDKHETDSISDPVNQSTGAPVSHSVIQQVTGAPVIHSVIQQITGACGSSSDMIQTNDKCNEKHTSDRLGNQAQSQTTNTKPDPSAELTSPMYTNPHDNTLVSRSSNDVNSLIRIPNSEISRNQSAYNNNRTTNEAARSNGTSDVRYNQNQTSPNGTLGMGVCIDKPKYPKYAIRSVRLDTFNTWPSYLTQSPEELACAGFFFTGIEDHCRCFYCGGGLKHWDPEDQPWIEHARWYHHCPFVRQNKGDKFIEDVKSGRPIQNTPTIQNVENSRQTVTQTSNATQNHFLNHPAVQIISEFGYDTDAMQTAFNSLVQNGCKDITATSLLERIFMQEVAANGNSTENKSLQPTTKSNNTNEPVKNDSQQVPATDPELELSIKSLEEENQNLKDQQTCKICLDEPVAIVFLPCGHMAACTNCAPALRKCPICRAFIKGTVKAIMC